MRGGGESFRFVVKVPASSSSRRTAAVVAGGSASCTSYGTFLPMVVLRFWKQKGVVAPTGQNVLLGE